MKKIIMGFFVVLCILLMDLAACTSQNLDREESIETATTSPVSESSKQSETKQITFVMSQQPREPGTLASIEELQILAENNVVFACDLYSHIRTQEGNLCFSPYSISQVLAMVYAGAQGETEEKMAQTLRFTCSQEELHRAFNSLSLQINQYERNIENDGDQDIQLNIGNSVWGQEGYVFIPEYLDILARYYGTGIYQLDFIQQPEEARTAINEWVEQETGGKIIDLLPPESIRSLTRLILINSIYMNASWESPFNEKATEDGLFFLKDGDQVAVPMMKKDAYLNYMEGNYFQAIKLPYSGNRFSMGLLVPESGSYDLIEKRLTHDLIAEIIDNFELRQVSLSLPKFSFESSLQLKDILSDMGMSLAFTDAADFSGIDGNQDLYIDDISHRGFISVDENGTEAAAASEVKMALIGILDEPIDVMIDHPFIYYIYDEETGTILFMGRVFDPTGQ